MKLSRLVSNLVGCSFFFLLSSCSHIQLDETDSVVNVYYSLAEKSNCKYLGDVIGSDGNIMTFLFMSNPSISRGALNDIRNNARAMGGDTVYILRDQLLYSTSTTFLGSVYDCKVSDPA